LLSSPVVVVSPVNNGRALPCVRAVRSYSLDVAIEAAGAFRRTPLERRDQRVAWERSDQAFFAAGACHVLAWTGQERFPDRAIGLTAIRVAGGSRVFHTYATWEGWAFDHSGWNAEPALVAVNADFEGRPLERVEVASDLAEFCGEHHHRMPQDFWQDPVPRARAYVERYQPPWA
jgi:hypothetical protein